MYCRLLAPTLRLLAACAVLLVAAGCQREVTPAAPTAAAPKLEAEVVENGAISVAPITSDSRRVGSGKGHAPVVKVDWSPLELESGQAWISCELDYSLRGDGTRLLAMDRESLETALHDCAERGVLRLRYSGRISADFTALVERVARVADVLKVSKRVLDLDSAGGQVEDAIIAGDFIAESAGRIWVRGIPSATALRVPAHRRRRRRLPASRHPRIIRRFDGLHAAYSSRTAIGARGARLPGAQRHTCRRDLMMRAHRSCACSPTRHCSLRLTRQRVAGVSTGYACT